MNYEFDIMKDIKIYNLSFKIGKENLIFNKFTLIFPDIPIIGIVGRNGVGKTLLAEIMIGKRKEQQGRILIDNFDISQLKTSIRSGIVNLSFQKSNYVFYNESVIKEITEVIKINRKRINNEKILEIAHQYLDKFGLSEKANISPFNLSGGERRKLSFLLLDIINPDVIIYDEPTIGLDSGEKNELRKMILNKKENNKRVIVITHDIEFLSKVTNYFIVLNRKENKFTNIGYMGKIFDFFLYRFSDYFPEIADFKLLKYYIKAINENNTNIQKNLLKLMKTYEIFETNL